MNWDGNVSYYTIGSSQIVHIWSGLTARQRITQLDMWEYTSIRLREELEMIPALYVRM
jgi:hypothetical protein